MLATTVARLRFVASITFGLPLSAWSLDRLVDAARDSQRKRGPLGPADAERPSGPPLDDEIRREMQLRRFRQQARRAVRETTYYARLFAHLGLDPARLRYEDIPHLPLTPK